MIRLWLAVFLMSAYAFSEAQAPEAEAPAAGVMTPDALDKIFGELGSNVQREQGVWTFNYNNVQLTCLISIEHDRMRIIAPIMLVSRLSEEQRDNMLEANYHSALDARYSTNAGVAYSAFIHPLSPLTENQIVSAIDQVASLVITFGSSYSSGALQFGAPSQGEGEEAAEEKGTEITT